MFNQTVNTVAINDITDVEFLVANKFVSVLTSPVGLFSSTVFSSTPMAVSGDPQAVNATYTKTLV